MRVEPANKTQRISNGSGTRKQFLSPDSLLQKFPVLLLAGILLLTSLIFALLISKSGFAIGFILIVLLVGLPIVYGVITYPKFGILVLFIAAYLLFIPMKMDTGGFPLGTVMDALEYLLILGFFIKQKQNPNWGLYNNPLSYITLIWIGYNFLELVNPESVSALAWVYTIRTTAVVIIMYFVFVYQIREVNFITLLFKVWIALAFIGALDAFKQEYFGYFQSEHDYLYNDPEKVELLFQGGHMRKFSIFSDPVAFAYNMASATVLCITLMLGPIKVYKKYILGLLSAFFMYTMLFSGTRGAYPLVPAALMLLCIINYNKKMLVYGIIGAVFFVFMVFVPTSNGTIVRFQSAFRPKGDPSYNARIRNQARIKPFIQTHPFGGGLGSTGIWGERFAPGSMLAGFPPDSGYVRVAVELGSIGILLLCIFIFTALYTGINNYFLIRDPVLKNYCLAATLVVFTYNVGNFPQEAIVQFPSNVIFFLAVALIPICYRLDKLKPTAQTNG